MDLTRLADVWARGYRYVGPTPWQGESEYGKKNRGQEGMKDVE